MESCLAVAADRTETVLLPRAGTACKARLSGSRGVMKSLVSQSCCKTKLKSQRETLAGWKRLLRGKARRKDRCGGQTDSRPKGAESLEKKRERFCVDPHGARLALRAGIVSVASIDDRQ